MVTLVSGQRPRQMSTSLLELAQLGQRRTHQHVGLGAIGIARQYQQNADMDSDQKNLSHRSIFRLNIDDFSNINRAAAAILLR